MKQEEILTFAVSVVETWGLCVLQPLKTITKMMRSYNDQEPFGYVGKIWVPSLLLSTIFNYPLMQTVGIEWNNVGYYAVNQSLAIISLIANGVVAYACLKLFRVAVEWYRIMILYTIVIVYSPIINLVSIPANYQYYMFLRGLKFDQNTAMERAII